jgi:vitamin B12 transporter
VQGLTLAGRVMPGWRSTLRVTRSVDEYATVTSASPYAELGTIATTEQRVSWENSVDTPVGTALGVLERTTQDVSKPGAPYDVSSRGIDGAALALDGSAGAHRWQASVRRDHDSQFGSQTTGGMGYAYAITPAWQAGLAYGTSFVAPSFNQLYYPGYGNPALQPERGHSAELNLRWSSDAQDLRASAYRQRVRGYITPGQNAVNVARVSVDGVTVAWQGRWQGGSAGVSVDHLTPVNESAGTPLVRRARNDAKAMADQSLGAFSLGATVTAYGSRPDTAYDANFVPVPVTLGAYATLDLRADWQAARDWTIGVRVNNAADKAYQTAYGYQQPRREGYLLLAWRPR